MARNAMDSDIRKTPPWREAEQKFNQVHTWSVFSIMGVSPTLGPTLEELDQELTEILAGCPEFFPAWFKQGEYMLRIGETAKGEEFIDKAFNHLVNIVREEEELRQMLSPRIENLEKLLRYDLAVKYLEKAIRLFPDTATYYDDLAFYILQLPDRDNSEALRRQEEALEIDPGNDYFVNNLGWVHLMNGNYQQAQEYFQKAMEFNPDNPSAWENLEAAEYMDQHRLTYFEYLLRPADMDMLNDLFKAADFQGAAELCQVYNTDRREAFKIHHLQKKNLPSHEILNILQPFKFFMNTLEKRVDDEIFLYENMDLVHNKFKYFLYQFLLNSDNVDELLLDDICRSLTVFYDFLRETNLLTTDQYKRFVGLITPLIKEFSGKIDQFNRVRH
ncbi:MAG: tetratricopeptide repeat protein, partial [Candidatus Aminicenantes bacterium]